MGFYSIPIVEAQVRAGQLKPLGVTGKTRSVIFPNVPTIAESGLAGYDGNHLARLRGTEGYA